MKTEAKFLKAGQFPEFEITPPKDLETALGEHAKLYRKGITLRHHGYGLGGLTYFRRIIEETTDEMLDLVVGALEETQSDPTLIEKLKAAKEGKRYDDKVKLVAELLPQHLRPGGVNPFALLHELLSKGIHNL